jgi:hypothetical protein
MLHNEKIGFAIAKSACIHCGKDQISEMPVQEVRKKAHLILDVEQIDVFGKPAHVVVHLDTKCCNCGTRYFLHNAAFVGYPWCECI